MIARLQGFSRALRKRSSVAPAALPDGERVYAIGDVHGCRDLLDALLDRIAADDERRAPAHTQIIFLGDLVDRGPDSRGVVTRLLEMTADGHSVRCIKGNHEEMFLAALSSDKTDAMRFFVRNGGRETLLSYGIDEDEYEHASLSELRDLARERVPAEHLAFLERCENILAIGDYAFVHAGVRPGVPISEQSPADLRWIRREFLDSRRDHGAVVIHGHSISPKADVCQNRIGIDTGAFASGVLTAIGLEGSDRWWLATDETE